MFNLSELPLLRELVALIGVGAMVTAGTLQYRQTSKREFEKPLRETQLRLYVEATSAAAILATHARGSEPWEKAKTEFLRLYFGALAILESKSVEAAMIAFKQCLDAGEDAQLANLSLRLAHTCRESAGHDWGVSLPQLEGKYQNIDPRHPSRSKSGPVKQTP